MWNEVPTQATNFIGLAAASAMGLVYQVLAKGSLHRDSHCCLEIHL